jgi:prevent-host-death family protein
MQTVNIHEAKTHLSKLIEKAAQGEPFIIAKAGKPLVRVTSIAAPAGKKRKRLGFMAGLTRVPRNFDRIGRDEIAALFGAEQ